MFPEVAEIQRLRKSLGLSQEELAELAGVSQSTIAKIENGNISPAYDNIIKIFNALEKRRRKRGTKAKDIMHRLVVGINVNQRVKDAIEIMEKDRFSQLPVFDQGRAVGSISDQTILNRMIDKDSGVPLSELPISRVMDEPFPTLDKDAPLTLIYEILKHSSAVLIMEKEKVAGIITKADLFKIV